MFIIQYIRQMITSAKKVKKGKHCAPKQRFQGTKKGAKSGLKASVFKSRILEKQPHLRLF